MDEGKVFVYGEGMYHGERKMPTRTPIREHWPPFVLAKEAVRRSWRRIDAAATLPGMTRAFPPAQRDRELDDHWRRDLTGHQRSDAIEQTMAWIDLPSFRDAMFGDDTMTELAGWLAGRAFRRSFGPRPGGVDMVDSSGFPGEPLGALALRIAPADQPFRMLWARGWWHEHQRLRDADPSGDADLGAPGPG